MKQLCSGACPVASKTDTVRQLVDVVYVCSDIYNILRLVDNNQSIERKPSSKWLTLLSDLRLQRELKMKTEGKVATSLRSLGREVDATMAKQIKSS